MLKTTVIALVAVTAQFGVAAHAAEPYLLQLTAMNRFCFIHHQADMANGAASCRDNGGVKVDRGIDTGSHLNIATAAHGM